MNKNDVVVAEADEEIISDTADVGDDEELESTDVDEATEGADEESTDGEDVVVSFGEEEPAADQVDDKNWVTALRKKNREQTKEINELKRLRAAQVQQNAPLGARPTLEEAEYDEVLFEEQLTDWLDRKADADNKQRQEQQQIDEQTRAWQGRLNEYESARTEFVPDVYDDAEDAVKTVMTDAQQGIMVHILGAKLAPLVMGLGKNNAQLQKLAEIKDNTLFAAEIGRLESKMKITRNKPKTVPEKRINAGGTGGGGVTSMSVLEKLREKAAKTGDMTEVMKYKAKMRQEANG